MSTPLSPVARSLCHPTLNLHPRTLSLTLFSKSNSNPLDTFWLFSLPLCWALSPNPVILSIPTLLFTQLYAKIYSWTIMLENFQSISHGLIKSTPTLFSPLPEPLLSNSIKTFSPALGTQFKFWLTMSCLQLVKLHRIFKCTPFQALDSCWRKIGTLAKCILRKGWTRIWT